MVLLSTHIICFSLEIRKYFNYILFNIWWYAVYIICRLWNKLSLINWPLSNCLLLTFHFELFDCMALGIPWRIFRKKDDLKKSTDDQRCEKITQHAKNFNRSTDFKVNLRLIVGDGTCVALFVGQCHMLSRHCIGQLFTTRYFWVAFWGWIGNGYYQFQTYPSLAKGIGPLHLD